MDLSKWKLVGEKLKKLRYPALILLLGVVLMLLPSREKELEPIQTPAPVVEEVADFKSQTERQLKTLLEQVAGAGKVSVLLSMKAGNQTVYQVDTNTDSQITDGTSSNAAQQSTVILSKDNLGQEAAVVRIIYPLFRGAVVVCQGADDPVVSLQVMQIVESITGLGSDRITIAKMK